MPSDWGRFLPVGEYKLRHFTKAGNVTPFALWHGWFRVSPLQRTLDNLKEIPYELAVNDWVKELWKDCQEISSFFDLKNQAREEQQDNKYNEDRTNILQYSIGGFGVTCSTSSHYWCFY